MKIDRNIQIPNIYAYGAVYAVVFGISIWLLVFHKDNPTNWLLYVGMAILIVGGLGKLALHSRKALQRS